MFSLLGIRQSVNMFKFDVNQFTSAHKTISCSGKILIFYLFWICTNKMNNIFSANLTKIRIGSDVVRMDRRTMVLNERERQNGNCCTWKCIIGFSVYTILIEGNNNYGFCTLHKHGNRPICRIK